MTHSELLTSIDELLETPAGTVSGDARLKELDGWDSLAVISFMAMAEERWQRKVLPVDIAKCETVDHLYALVAGSK